MPYTAHSHTYGTAAGKRPEPAPLRPARSRCRDCGGHGHGDHDVHDDHDVRGDRRAARRVVRCVRTNNARSSSYMAAVRCMSALHEATQPQSPPLTRRSRPGASCKKRRREARNTYMMSAVVMVAHICAGVGAVSGAHAGHAHTDKTTESDNANSRRTSRQLVQHTQYTCLIKLQPSYHGTALTRRPNHKNQRRAQCVSGRRRATHLQTCLCRGASDSRDCATRSCPTRR